MPNPSDPLAGLPIVTGNMRRVKPRSSVIPLAAAKANLKRAKMTGVEYKAARDAARQLTGYDPATSPIKEMTTLDALTEIGALLDFTKPHSIPLELDRVQRALVLNTEVRKRLLSRQLTFGSK